MDDDTTGLSPDATPTPQRINSSAKNSASNVISFVSSKEPILSGEITNPTNDDDDDDDDVKVKESKVKKEDKIDPWKKANISGPLLAATTISSPTTISSSNPPSISSSTTNTATTAISNQTITENHQTSPNLDLKSSASMGSTSQMPSVDLFTGWKVEKKAFMQTFKKYKNQMDDLVKRQVALVNTATNNALSNNGGNTPNMENMALDSPLAIKEDSTTIKSTNLNDVDNKKDIFISQLKKRIEVLYQENEKLKNNNEIKELYEMNFELQDNLKKIRSEFDSLQNQNFELERKLSDLRISHAKAQRQSTSENPEMESLKKRIQDMEQTLSQSERRCGILEAHSRDTASAVEEERQRTISAVAEVEARESRLAAEFAAYKKRAQQILEQGANNSTQTRLIELEQQNDFIERELRDWKAKYEMAMQENQVLSQDSEKLREKIKSLESEISHPSQSSQSLEKASLAQTYSNSKWINFDAREMTQLIEEKTLLLQQLREKTDSLEALQENFNQIVQESAETKKAHENQINALLERTKSLQNKLDDIDRISASSSTITTSENLHKSNSYNREGRKVISKDPISSDNQIGNNSKLHPSSSLISTTSQNHQNNHRSYAEVIHLEYLKTIILKMVSSKSSLSEKHALIPVISSLLSLNPDELQVLQEGSFYGPDVSAISRTSAASSTVVNNLVSRFF